MDSGPAVQWVGAAVRQRREAIGFSQTRLANVCEEIGLPLSQADIAAIEGGRRQVGAIESLMLCVALGTTLERLLYGDAVEGPQGSVGGNETPAPSHVDWGGRRFSTWALAEVLMDGLTNADGPTANADHWRATDPATEVDPAEVQGVIGRLIDDPDLAAFIDEGYNPADLERIRFEVVSQLYPVPFERLEQLKPGMVLNIYQDTTYTTLVRLIADERAATIGRDLDPRGRRTIEAAARRRIRRAINMILAAQQEQGGKR